MRIAVAVLAAAVVTAVSACTGTVDDPPEAAPTFRDEPAPEPPSALLYLDRTSLQRYDLATGASELVAAMPSADVAVSPDGALLVAVEERHPRGPGPEAFRDPHLVIASTSGEEIPSELGPGRSPVWSPTGTAVAAIAATPLGETIVVHNPPGGIVETAAPTDELWNIVGWNGGRIVAIGSRSGVVTVPADGSTIGVLARGLEPNELWGVSPADQTALVIDGRGTKLIGEQEGRVLGIGAAVGDGAWSWDGRAIALSTFGGPPRLMLIDVADQRAREVAKSRGAQGNVVWADDSTTFAFVRVDPDKRTRLEAVICTAATICEPAFSWAQGVTLLGFN